MEVGSGREWHRAGGRGEERERGNILVRERPARTKKVVLQDGLPGFRMKMAGS